MDRWTSVYQTTVLTTKIAPHRLQAIKILNHWYLTPSWLCRMKHLLTPDCCGQRADTIHCWLRCPRLTPFWKEVLAVFTQMTGCDIDYSPSQVLLHNWDLDTMHPREARMVSTLLALEKTEIAAKWKSTVPTSVSNWYNRIWECFIISKITDEVLRNLSPTYHSSLERDWFPILSYLADRNIVSSRFLDKSFLTF